VSVSELPTPEKDDLAAAVECVKRLLPVQAELAKGMLDNLRAAGLSEEQALKLVAHALFRT